MPGSTELFAPSAPLDSAGSRSRELPLVEPRISRHYLGAITVGRLPGAHAARSLQRLVKRGRRGFALFCRCMRPLANSRLQRRRRCCCFRRESFCEALPRLQIQFGKVAKRTALQCFRISTHCEVSSSEVMCSYAAANFAGFSVTCSARHTCCLCSDVQVASLTS